MNGFLSFFWFPVIKKNLSASVFSPPARNFDGLLRVLLL